MSKDRMGGKLDDIFVVQETPLSSKKVFLDEQAKQSLKQLFLDMVDEVVVDSVERELWTLEENADLFRKKIGEL